MSFESNTQVRFENALHFASHNRGELVVSLELIRTLPRPKVGGHVSVAVEAGLLRKYPYFAPPRESRNQPLTLYPVRKALVGATLSSSKSSASPMITMTHCPADDLTAASMEINNPLFVYDNVLVGWLDLNRPGTHHISVAGNLAIESFIGDMRTEGEVDPLFNTIADFCITACNYAQREV